MDIFNDQYFMSIWEWFSQTMTIETFIKLSVIYFFIIWISIIVWVIKDITNRTDSIFLQFLSILLVVLLTPLWVFLYLLIRPTKTLFERYYEEIEVNLDFLTENIWKKLKTKKKDSIQCPECNYPIENSFKFCPNCNIELKYNCKSLVKYWYG